MWPHASFVVVDTHPGLPAALHGRFYKGDVRDKAFMRNIFGSHEFDCIIHLAAAHKDFGIEQEEYFEVNEGGTEVLCRLAAEFGVKKLIFYSSVAVYGDRNEPTTDQTLPSPSNDYGASKLAAERVVMQWQRQDPSRTAIIIRPALVFGEGNEANMFRLIDQINKGRYFNVGKGDNIKSIAYVKNLVDATFYLYQHQQPGLHVYNYADEPHLQTAEIGLTIAAELGKPRPRSFPLTLLLLMAKPFDLLIRLTGRDLPISSMRVKKYATRTHHRAQQLFAEGFKPRYTSQEGLARMVAWYKQREKEQGRVSSS
ncbi:MAG: NAD-dependent epimerase/dehydratase family protein [Chitinophagaceae bacterium]|jgi:nucleoside-diphosphate-sugar epimerase|nr:NAD-dependent epimerase/dehydratase family protein [Chitinophagaceae bacterium]